MPAKTLGFTLVEMMVATAVLMIFFTASATILQTSMQSLGNARVRSEALRFAQQQIEMAENLPYASVGTIGGIPAGTLSPTSTSILNGTTFTIKTSVFYIDDPYDNLAPLDPVPADYKRVRVSVTWNGIYSSISPVTLMTDIVPNGVETLPGTGTLSILVFNSQGKPIENANVHIEAKTVTPAVSIDAFTDSTGSLTLPGAPICNACYFISVSKSGYTTDRTYGTNEVANPIKPYATIIESKLTEVSFAIDTTATLILNATHTNTLNYSPFAGVQMTLQGSKIIGKTIDGDPVYKVIQQVTTGSGGAVTVSNLEWDSYTIKIPTGSSVDFAGSWPFNPISVNPGDKINYSMVVAPASANSLLVQVTDDTHQPLPSVIATLSNATFIATKSAGLSTQGDRSQIFFSNLDPVIYNLTISADTYATTSASVSISGDVQENFMMPLASPIP